MIGLDISHTIFILMAYFGQVTNYLDVTIKSLPLTIIGGAFLLISFLCLVLYLNTRYTSAQPNEWLLVIKDGKLKKAGVGLKYFVLPGETIVKFPSRIERVEFKAMNITEQMQGISIEGFAFWSVNKDKDGPFKCYKYMDGGNVNKFVKTLCESIVRNELANSKLSQVMKNRDLLKQSIKNQLKPQLSGWGIWLQTVQLTDVKICSKKVFEDLQAEYRSETNLKAQIIKLQAITKSQSQKIQSSLKMLKIKQQGATQQIKSTLEQELKRKQKDTTFYQQNTDMQIKKLNQSKLLELQHKKKDHEIALAEAKNQNQKQDKNIKQKLQNDRKNIEKDKLLTPIALKKHKIDSLQSIYSTINFGETKLGQFIPQKSKGIYSLLPGFSELINQNSK